MGVSGTGKSTVGRALAQRLGVPFAEGDEFHSEQARAKMASGTPLTDADRWPWLDRLRDWLDGHAGQLSSDRNSPGEQAVTAVMACSALRRSYRDVLRDAHATVLFCELSADAQTLETRMQHRPGHFMPPSLLESQLDAVENLQADECGIQLAATGDPEAIVDQIVHWLEQRS